LEYSYIGAVHIYCTMAELIKDTVVKATSHKNQGGFTNRVISIPDNGFSYYRRKLYSDGHVELYPMEIMEASVGVKNGNE